jgi:hypothetical protein
MKTVGAPVTYFEAMVYNNHRTGGPSSMEMCRTNTDGTYGKNAAVARVEQDRSRHYCGAYKKHFSNKNNSCYYDCAFDDRLAVVWNGAMRTDVSVAAYGSSQRTERIIQNSIPRTMARNE